MYIYAERWIGKELAEVPSMEIKAGIERWSGRSSPCLNVYNGNLYTIACEIKNKCLQLSSGGGVEEEGFQGHLVLWHPVRIVHWRYERHNWNTHFQGSNQLPPIHGSANSSFASKSHCLRFSPLTALPSPLSFSTPTSPPKNTGEELLGVSTTVPGSNAISYEDFSDTLTEHIWVNCGSLFPHMLLIPLDRLRVWPFSALLFIEPYLLHWIVYFLRVYTGSLTHVRRPPPQAVPSPVHHKCLVQHKCYWRGCPELPPAPTPPAMTLGILHFLFLLLCPWPVLLIQLSAHTSPSPRGLPWLPYLK